MTRKRTIANHDCEELNLATYPLMRLRYKSYEQLKFLCKIWGLEEVYEEYCKPYTFNGGKYQGCKEEIIVRLRIKMRQKENRNKSYIVHERIKTPKSIRPQSI